MGLTAGVATLGEMPPETEDLHMDRPDRDIWRSTLLAGQLFKAMQMSELNAILTMATERQVRRGQIIFQKGDAGSSMMAVLTGRVRVSANSPEGKELTLDIIDPGEVFGEIALLDGKSRSADATATEDSTLLVLGRREVLPFLMANPDLMFRVLMVVCDRLRQSSVALEDLALLDLPGRLARVLLKLADDYGHKTGDGVRINVRLSQKDLSNLAATSRESVNKQMAVWRSKGVLATEGGSMILRDRAALEELVGPGRAELPRSSCFETAASPALAVETVGANSPPDYSGGHRISRTARPHLLPVEAYGTYHAGATFGTSRRTR